MICVAVLRPINPAGFNAPFAMWTYVSNANDFNVILYTEFLLYVEYKTDWYLK